MSRFLSALTILILSSTVFAKTPMHPALDQLLGPKLQEIASVSDEIAGVLAPGGDPDISQLRNHEVLSQLNITSVKEHKGRISRVSPELRQSIFNTILNHKVAGMNQLFKYDPTGELGLCWGRAMATHIEALREGVNKEAIKKLWAVGSMNGPNFRWAYHVATAVRGDDYRWYVLDPFFYRVMTAEEWYQILRDSNEEENINLYVTNASRYSRMSSDKYDKSVLSKDAYTHGFFTDLLESFREESHALATQKHH